MLYIIGLIKNGENVAGEILRYKLFDTEYCMHMSKEQMQDITLNHKIRIVKVDL